MRIWLVQKGFDALKRGNVRAFAKMLLVLFLIGYSATEEKVLYCIWRIRRFITKKKILKVNNYKMLTLSGDRGISHELAVHGFREKFMTQYIKGAVKSNYNCIDIGANLGYYTLIESRKVKQGTVYAFEPDEGNFSVLQRNIILNEARNVILSDKAVADKKGSKDFYLYPRRNWSSFNDRIGYRYFSKVRVEAVSLDDIYKKVGKNINLVRMDVEGYESNVVRGGKKMLRECRDLMVVIEIHPHLAPPKDILSMLQTLKKSGFAVSAIMLEVLPRHYKYLKYFNSYRLEVGLLPFGKLSNKNCNFEFLEKLLLDRERGFNYYPHVVFKKH